MRISPPGALKQQLSCTTVVFEQLSGRPAGHVTDAALANPMAKVASTSVIFDNMIHEPLRVSATLGRKKERHN
jgi:hypothetical protein